jgi:hypothetical protein
MKEGVIDDKLYLVQEGEIKLEKKIKITGDFPYNDRTEERIVHLTNISII